jgi:hypothetical protein
VNKVFFPCGHSAGSIFFQEVFSWICPPFDEKYCVGAG